jgi:3-hydroxybutyryl-CoA dehydrogenase
MAEAQVVIEAVVERLEVKQTLFQHLESIVSADTIFATNTSSISIASIGQGVERRNRVCGMHFFNPVPLMKLVEIIPGPFTDLDVVATIKQLAQSMGKISVLAKDGPGFLVNLGGRAYSTEALHILAEGVATPEQIDRIMTGSLGFRMGPFELMDLTGIDTNFAVSTYVHKGHQFDPRLKTVPSQERLVESGRFGRKTGAGFYDYSTPRPKALPRPVAGPRTPLMAVLPESHQGFGILAESGLTSSSSAYAPILISPWGEDASTAAARQSLDPARVVAIDFTGIDRQMITVMTPPVASEYLGPVVDWLFSAGIAVEVVDDSPGFVAQRILAMIVNLGCEMAQSGVGSPEDIDTAMQLGLNYPGGPLGMGDRMGASRVWEVLQNMQFVTGSDRYRPSLWLRRRAQLGLSLQSSPPDHQVSS